MLDKAIQLACEVHDGQKDLAGKPYILHPLRVMMKMETELEMVIAVLHDVVEDGGERLFLEADFPRSVFVPVYVLTKNKKESYTDYIHRISLSKSCSTARKVKLADLYDNLDPERTALLNPVKNAKRKEKYLWAVGYLLSSEEK